MTKRRPVFSGAGGYSLRLHRLKLSLLPVGALRARAASVDRDRSFRREALWKSMTVPKSLTIRFDLRHGEFLLQMALPGIPSV
jgi:hypothetical protein